MDTDEKKKLQEKMHQEMEDEDRGVAVAERPKSKRKLKPPSNYKVVFHNDDFTPMEFVVWLLQDIFHHPVARAQQIMVDVHKKGKGIAGIYPSEIAETKVYNTMMTAKENNFPLLVTSEEM